MTLPIIEQPIYGQFTFETKTRSILSSWVDQTANIVYGISYSEGSRLGTPGSNSVDVGTLTVTLKNVATVPGNGEWVRIRRTGTSEYVFTGYIQDIEQRIVFDNSVSYNTPIVLTTLLCLDWVGFISQYQAVGVGGIVPGSGGPGTIETDSVYQWDYRVEALNRIIDGTGASPRISYTKSGTSFDMGDTDLVGTFADHLNLLSNSTDAIWYGTHVPQDLGPGNLIAVKSIASISSSGKTFTDVAGSAGQLHYTEIDFENATANIANTIFANNRVRFHVPDSEVTIIGGFSEENYLIVNNSNVVGIGIDFTEQKSDLTSIAAYGNRQSEIDVNVAMPAISNNVNLVSNPSLEYSDEGYSGGANVRVRRRKPSEDASPFAAYNGQWAIRVKQVSANATGVADYSGGESDAIPVVAGRTYYGSAQAARGNPSATNARARARIIWLDDDEATISTSNGAYVSLTNANTWYSVVTTGVTAPANAVRAKVGIEFSRSSGANIAAGNIHWGDAYMLSKASNAYFDGDTPADNDYHYIWTGGVGASPSYKLDNKVDDVAAAVLAKYSTTSMRATRIRWNAQEDVTAVSSIHVGSTISVVYDGTTTSYRIVGIDGNIDAERYMIDYYLAKA